MLCARLIQSSHLARSGLLGCSSVVQSGAVNKLAATQFNTKLHTSKTYKSSGNHVTLWSLERVVSVAQIPALVIPFTMTTPLTDAVFCTLAVLHSHWGIEAVVVDYVRPSLFNGSTVIPNICVSLVWALSAFTLGALYYFNYTDVGIVNAIKMLWKL